VFTLDRNYLKCSDLLYIETKIGLCRPFTLYAAAWTDDRKYIADVYALVIAHIDVDKIVLRVSKFVGFVMAADNFVAGTDSVRLDVAGAVEIISPDQVLCRPWRFIIPAGALGCSLS